MKVKVWRKGDDGTRHRSERRIKAAGSRRRSHCGPSTSTQLNKTIARYGRVDLLCIDKLGYMEFDWHGAELLFQVLTEREERNSVAIASNESFAGWTKTFTALPPLRGHRRPPDLYSTRARAEEPTKAD